MPKNKQPDLTLESKKEKLADETTELSLNRIFKLVEHIFDTNDKYFKDQGLDLENLKKMERNYFLASSVLESIKFESRSSKHQKIADLYSLLTSYWARIIFLQLPQLSESEVQEKIQEVSKLFAKQCAKLPLDNFINSMAFFCSWHGFIFDENLTIANLGEKFFDRKNKLVLELLPIYCESLSDKNFLLAKVFLGLTETCLKKNLPIVLYYNKAKEYISHTPKQDRSELLVVVKRIQSHPRVKTVPKKSLPDNTAGDGKAEVKKSSQNKKLKSDVDESKNDIALKPESSLGEFIAEISNYIELAKKELKVKNPLMSTNVASLLVRAKQVIVDKGKKHKFTEECLNLKIKIELLLLEAAQFHMDVAVDTELEVIFQQHTITNCVCIIHREIAEYLIEHKIVTEKYYIDFLIGWGELYLKYKQTHPSFFAEFSNMFSEEIQKIEKEISTFSSEIIPREMEYLQNLKNFMKKFTLPFSDKEPQPVAPKLSRNSLTDSGSNETVSLDVKFVSSEEKLTAASAVASGNSKRKLKKQKYKSKCQQRTKKLKLEAAQQAQQKIEAEARAKQEAEARAKQEAEARAKQEAEARAKQEAEARAKQEAEARAKQEAEARAKREAEAKKKESTRQAQAKSPVISERQVRSRPEKKFLKPEALVKTNHNPEIRGKGLEVRKFISRGRKDSSQNSRHTLRNAAKVSIHQKIPTTVNVNSHEDFPQLVSDKKTGQNTVNIFKGLTASQISMPSSNTKTAFEPRMNLAVTALAGSGYAPAAPASVPSSAPAPVSPPASTKNSSKEAISDPATESKLQIGADQFAILQQTLKSMAAEIVELKSQSSKTVNNPTTENKFQVGSDQLAVLQQTLQSLAAEIASLKKPSLSSESEAGFISQNYADSLESEDVYQDSLPNFTESYDSSQIPLGFQSALPMNSSWIATPNIHSLPSASYPSQTGNMNSMVGFYPQQPSSDFTGYIPDPQNPFSSQMDYSSYGFQSYSNPMNGPQPIQFAYQTMMPSQGLMPFHAIMTTQTMMFPQGMEQDLYGPPFIPVPVSDPYAGTFDAYSNSSDAAAYSQQQWSQERLFKESKLHNRDLLKDKQETRQTSIMEVSARK